MALLAKNNFQITLKDGRKLGYSEYGDPNGKPLFYFHGWPGSRLLGWEVNTAAKKLGIKVISIERPGFGLSDFQENRQLLDWPDDVVQLADQLKIKKFAVMGVSGGGPYAAVCGYMIPNRITKIGIVVGLGPANIKGAFEGLSPINKFAWENYHHSQLLRNLAGFWYLLQINFLPFLAGIGFAAKADQKLIDQSFKKRQIESLKQAFSQGIKGPAWDLKIFTSPWGFKVKDIKLPVYLWYGDADKNVSLNMGKYYASEIKDSKLTIYPGEGHLCRMNHEGEILRQLIS